MPFLIPDSQRMPFLIPAHALPHPLMPPMLFALSATSSLHASWVFDIVFKVHSKDPELLLSLSIVQTLECLTAVTIPIADPNDSLHFLHLPPSHQPPKNCTNKQPNASNWDILPRPYRKIGRSSTELPVGASSFPSVPNFLFPLCPHLDAYGQKYGRMQLHLGKRYQGCIQDFFRATDHRCDFVVIIPKARASVYSTEAAYYQGTSNNGDSEEQEVNDDLLRFSPSPEPEHNPRISTPRHSAESARPCPRPRPRPSSDVGPSHRSFFSTSVANARAFSDVNLIDVCWAGALSGSFESIPSSHPAFPTTGGVTHRVLQPYDEQYNANCLQRTYQHLLFLGTAIGQAVRALNSTLGVSSDVVQSLIDDSIRCPGCSCQYSFDGFNHHIQDGHCGNRPEIIPVVRASSPPPRLLLENRELPPGKCLGNAADFLDSTFGAAWLEWNSKLGIPTDVWALTSTAIQECATCHFVRTFPAHAAHLHPGTGACNDLVDESIDY
ncbi:hypothetical protein B0H14DRAFT_3604537 [Mycena olivaceomarginata]|nr:hypothetical protein B0H14DRAFT_3604537 [Mycena olivaceomarginata]